MSGRPRIETFDRDNQLVSIVFKHRGKENAIGTQELTRALNEKGYKIDAHHIHSVILKIITERHLPICSKMGQGYYWATTKQDIQASIDDMQAKIDGLQNRIDFLKSFIIE